MLAEFDFGCHPIGLLALVVRLSVRIFRFQKICVAPWSVFSKVLPLHHFALLTASFFVKGMEQYWGQEGQYGTIWSCLLQTHVELASPEPRGTVAMCSVGAPVGHVGLGVVGAQDDSQEVG